MTEGFRIDGHFIPISYDTNNDRKLQSTEFLLPAIILIMIAKINWTMKNIL